MTARLLQLTLIVTALRPGASADTVYGIVSAAKGSVKIDGTYYTEYAVDTFNKAGESATKKVLIESADGDLDKGDLACLRRLLPTISTASGDITCLH